MIVKLIPHVTRIKRPRIIPIDTIESNQWLKFITYSYEIFWLALAFVSCSYWFLPESLEIIRSSDTVYFHHFRCGSGEGYVKCKKKSGWHYLRLHLKLKRNKCKSKGFSIWNVFGQCLIVYTIAVWDTTCNISHQPPASEPNYFICIVSDFVSRPGSDIFCRSLKNIKFIIRFPVCCISATEAELQRSRYIAVVRDKKAHLAALREFWSLGKEPKYSWGKIRGIWKSR